jgi:hypothetical protein
MYWIVYYISRLERITRGVHAGERCVARVAKKNPAGAGFFVFP